MAKATKPVEVNVENREILPYGRGALKRLLHPLVHRALDQEKRFTGNQEARAEFWKGVALAAFEEVGRHERQNKTRVMPKDLI